jgi:hypothetical protein
VTPDQNSRVRGAQLKAIRDESDTECRSHGANNNHNRHRIPDPFIRQGLNLILDPLPQSTSSALKDGLKLQMLKRRFREV